MKIAILGAGNMGGAIAASLAGNGFEVAVTAKSDATLRRVAGLDPAFSTTRSNTEAVKDADIVILAVKPWIAPGVLEEVSPHIKDGASLVSVVAGMSLEELLARVTGECSEREVACFRVIPNTAIRLGKSATFIASGKGVDEEKGEAVRDIFRLSGKVFDVEERDMGAVTALSSCGIAYFLRFIRAAVEGSVELGLRPGFATEVAAATAEGAAALLADGAHPEAEIDKVTTPGGLTIRGLNALEAGGFSAAVITALRASVK